MAAAGRGVLAAGLAALAAIYLPVLTPLLHDCRSWLLYFYLLAVASAYTVYALRALSTRLAAGSGEQEGGAG